jgi:hypothetical protein
MYSGADFLSMLFDVSLFLSVKAYLSSASWESVMNERLMNKDTTDCDRSRDAWKRNLVASSPFSTDRLWLFSREFLCTIVGEPINHLVSNCGGQPIRFTWLLFQSGNSRLKRRGKPCFFKKLFSLNCTCVVSICTSLSFHK